MIIDSLVTSSLALIGTGIGAFFSFNKIQALLDFRLRELEKKVDKHNNLVDRMYAVEANCKLHVEKIKVINHRIDDLEKEREG